ncbi:MAG: glycerol-3-phosphate 1-O-acyltransferase PlsY [Candidatus Marinimicrobia bacterium]|nr:glycerol-3-phosphate 1-O-acyltransferase PlsY [Candidatus Neomarinimicrobiota bacterium]
MDIAIVIILSYIIGSFPTAIIVGKISKGIDIRDYGSGNAGATNVFRELGWKLGLITAIIDVFKGFTATYWIAKIGSSNIELLMILAGISAILGHSFTIFGGFRGGKGVATATGMLIALFPIAIPICLVIFLITLFTTGHIALGSMSASITLPIILSIMKFVMNMNIDPYLFYFSLIIPIFIIFTHRSNIKKLIDGTEEPMNKLMLFKRKNKGK